MVISIASTTINAKKMINKCLEVLFLSDSCRNNFNPCVAAGLKTIQIKTQSHPDSEKTFLDHNDACPMRGSVP